MKLPIPFSNIREFLAGIRRAFRLTPVTFVLAAAGLLTLASAFVGMVKFTHRPHAKKTEAMRAAAAFQPQLQADSKQVTVPQIEKLQTKARIASVFPATPNEQSGEAELRTIPPTAAVDEEENEAGEHRREDWFYFQRAYPARAIPPEAPLRMREQLEREELRLKQTRTAFRDSAGAAAEPAQQAVWAALGPAPIAQGQTFGPVSSPVSGRVSAIALDPGYNGTTNQTVYVGAAQGGVWRSTDNGANWTPLLDNQPSLAVGAIAIDPTNPNIIYVGTGEGNRAGDTYYGQGLLKSVDGGTTWTQITGPVSTTAPGLPSFINCSFLGIEIDPTTPMWKLKSANASLAPGAWTRATIALPS